MDKNHEHYMGLAIEEAKKAGTEGEIPVGAVLVDENGVILAKSRNQMIQTSDPTAHAEIIAIRKAGQKIRNYRLLNTTLYVTIEPCLMCMGAMVHARISSLVLGAKDPKWGAAGSLYDLSADSRLNHRIEVISGVMEAQARKLMQNFFQKKRK